MNKKLIFLIVTSLVLLTCQNSHKRTNYIKGEYGYDYEFLNKTIRTIELVKDDSRLLLVPEYQGRVMTSSCRGLKGSSFGWINYDLIASSKFMEHFNAFGGEERLWLGPEGGQFSIFYEKDNSFIDQNWFVPAALDTEIFEVENQDSESVTLVKEFELKNYSGTIFNVKVTRKVTILSSNSIYDILEIKHNKSVHAVAYMSRNQLKNIGNNCWTKESGALSIWMLGMLKASPDVTVVFPYRKGDLGRIVKDDYIGKVPPNRLKIAENAVFFHADGKYRSKIGISPARAIPRIGSYDAKSNVLTIVEFSFPQNVSDYVNSALEIQKEPFSGDVINSYNDGVGNDGPQLGSFYELESSSPAAFLNPGEEITHIQTLYHFEGREKDLDILAKSLLNVSISEIKATFKNN